MKKCIIIGRFPLVEVFTTMVREIGIEYDLYSGLSESISEIEGMDFSQYDYLLVVYWRYYSAVTKIKARNPKIRVLFFNTWDEVFECWGFGSDVTVIYPRDANINFLKDWFEGNLGSN